MITRRDALLSGGASLVCATACERSTLKTSGNPARLTAQSGTLSPFASQRDATAVWTYNGQVSGPLLRMKRDEPIKLKFENTLRQPTSVHWHGLRIPNSMDGVGSITQPGVNSGDFFDYEFAAPDSGLFWYHPHMNSEKQIAKGMFGAIVVEDENPPIVDREIVWTLFDWGLDEAYQIPTDRAFQLWRGFHQYDPHRKITTNGIDAPPVALTRGERIRLRIVNTSSNRRYALKFDGHAPWIIAWDGNAVTPYSANHEPVMIANGERVDLIIDGVGSPGQAYRIYDVFDKYYDDTAPELDVTTINYREAPARRKLSDLPPATAPGANHIPEPDLANAIPIDIVLDQQLYDIGDIPSIGATAQLIAEAQGIKPGTKVPVWSMNGKPMFEDLREYFCIDPTPLFECTLGKTYILRYINKTPTDHPMHLHGHTFLMLRRNGVPYPRRMLRDTFMIMKDETVEIAFVADNIGDWMMHCHRGLHSHGGMMTTFHVS